MNSLLKIEKHIPVMLAETLHHLGVKENGIYLDGTLGSGGHSQALLENYPKIKIIAFDQDQEAIRRCQENPFFATRNIIFISDNFVNFPQHLARLNITQVDGFLFDLGLSSEQLDNPGRGFSYRQNAPLDMRMNQQAKLTAQEIINNCSYQVDMRMNQQAKLTAQEIINNCSYQELADIFFNYGEEFKAKRIARRVCQVRQKEKITTTQQLVSVVASCFPHKGNKHPARRVFQALRIAVNQELVNLSQGLEKSLQFLNIGGRVVVISYHSLEDRIVKQAFKKYDKLGSYQNLTKKPLTPTDKEVTENYRARSAKMRVIMRDKNN